MILNSTLSQLSEKLNQQDELLLVDFYAEGCGPCRMLGPKLELLSDEFGDQLNIAKVDGHENLTTLQAYGVRAFPTLILYKNGEELARSVGNRGYGQLTAMISPHLNSK